jgi:hypothetical protein
MKDDRNLLVFCIWSVLGFLGMGFILEGLARDSYLAGLLGNLAIVGAFISHMIVNYLNGQGFERGETALGLGLFGVICIVFGLGWVVSDTSKADYYIAITLFAVLSIGLIAYLSTRYGIRHAFSRFHFKPTSYKDGKK